MILSDSDETDNDDTVAIVNDAKKRRELAQQFEIEHAEEESPHRYGTRALMYDTDDNDAEEDSHRYGTRALMTTNFNP